jgi:rhodanese-related sulfurtransferase
MHIPLGQLSSQTAKLEKFREKPIIATCRTGHRSASACMALRKQGFEKIYNLSGGMLAWESASLPISKNRKS